MQQKPTNLSQEEDLW